MNFIFYQHLKESQTPKAEMFLSIISFHFPTRSACWSRGDTLMMAHRKSAEVCMCFWSGEVNLASSRMVTFRCEQYSAKMARSLLVRGGLSVTSGPEERARWVPFRERHEARELPIQHGGDPATFPIVEQVGKVQILVRQPKLHLVELFCMLCQHLREGVETRQRMNKSLS